MFNENSLVTVAALKGRALGLGCCLEAFTDEGELRNVESEKKRKQYLAKRSKRHSVTLTKQIRKLLLQ
jgi:hypothetical protein